MKIEPGTRCECRAMRCRATLAHDMGTQGCRADAVRMVTAAVGPSGFSPFMSPITESVPMCAACADFHEKGTK